jgi:hypothetical protein
LESKAREAIARAVKEVGEEKIKAPEDGKPPVQFLRALRNDRYSK